MATQAETQHGWSLAKAKDWLSIAAAAVVVGGGLWGIVHFSVSAAIAPLRSDIKAIDKRVERLERQGERHGEILSEVRERLTRVETMLLERDKETP